MDDFFRFSKDLGFWVFLVHPTVVSVLLSPSVERCFVSRMRDFFSYYHDLDELLLRRIGEGWIFTVMLDLEHLESNFLVHRWYFEAFGMEIVKIL